MIKIVPFEKKDFYKIKELLIDGFSKSFNKELNSNFLENDNCYGFVAKDEKKTVGYASIHIIEKLNRKSCLIEDVVIQKSERDKGIGKKLIEFLIDFSKLKKCDKIILNSNESNIPFYEKLGFFKSEIQMIIRN